MNVILIIIILIIIIITNTTTTTFSPSHHLYHQHHHHHHITITIRLERRTRFLSLPWRERGWMSWKRRYARYIFLGL
jgi:hypothetical protein